MSDTGTPSAAAAKEEKKKKERKPSAPVTAESFAELAGEMSRFLGMFASYKPLADENLGFAEWVVLCELKKGPSPRKKIAKTLGSDVTRVDQLLSSLQKSGYIDKPKGGDDNKGVELTAQGKTRIAAINGKLTPLLVKSLGGKDRAIKGGMKSLRVLSRTVTEPREGGGEGKGGKGGKDASPEKKAKKEAKAQRKAAKGAKTAKAPEKTTS